MCVRVYVCEWKKRGVARGSVTVLYERMWILWLFTFPYKTKSVTWNGSCSHKDTGFQHTQKYPIHHTIVWCVCVCCVCVQTQCKQTMAHFLARLRRQIRCQDTFSARVRTCCWFPCSSPGWSCSPSDWDWGSEGKGLVELGVVDRSPNAPTSIRQRERERGRKRSRRGKRADRRRKREGGEKRR